MAAERIFVGRKAELEQFEKVLDDPRGQAILVVGNRGMGKTWLINKMAETAENHPTLKCGCVRYEVTPTDSVDSTMALMMDNAFEAAQLEEGSFVGTKRRLEQWRSLLNVINIGDLVMSLRRDPQRNTRDQFLERLTLIAQKMPENGRAIFIIDPEKYMQKESDQAWAIVVKDLPEKIKFVFAQRAEDVLVSSETFSGLNNVERIPQERLDVLDQQAIDELLNLRAGKTGYTVTELRKALARYGAHPYAIGAALDLLEAGTKLEELPQDPTGIAAAQWKELSKRGKDAIRLFKAHAILEVGVPHDVVEAVSLVDSDTQQSVLADNYLSALLREEGYGKRIYHAILADYILRQIDEAEKKEYHSRAVKVYRKKLTDASEKQVRPDALSATRLPEHVLAVRGSQAFVNAFLNEASEPLLRLGLFDAAIAFSLRALTIVEPGSGEHGRAMATLAYVWDSRSELRAAEDVLRKAIKISQAAGDMEGVAIECGNLGVVYQKMQDPRRAEAMHRKALKTNKRLGRKDGMVADYINLSILYAECDEPSKAREMLSRAQEVSDRVDYPAIGAAYVNMAMAWKRSGGLKRSEDMFRKALCVYEDRGDIEGRAACCFNLGTVLFMRGQTEQAEDMIRQGLDAFESIGDHASAASAASLSAGIREAKGDLAEASRMFRRAFSGYRRAGRTKEMAEQCVNLGRVRRRLGDTHDAREYWQKAVELYRRIGMKAEVKKLRGWIEELDKDSGP